MRPLVVVAVALFLGGSMAGCITIEVPVQESTTPSSATVPARPVTSAPHPPTSQAPRPAGSTPQPSPPEPGLSARDENASTGTFEPHVIVAVPDTGINPYHEIYWRPERTEHPCTYIEDFPCDLPALPISIGKHPTWQEAVQADLDVWRSVQPGDWFWIPQTVFVAVGCDGAMPGASPWGDPICILDENDNHGTGITSTILMENPDALLVFMESHDQTHDLFDETQVPIDIYSHSNGFNGPNPYVAGTGETLDGPVHPVYVRAAGNQPDTTFDKYTRAHPDVITVGGGYAADRSATIVTTKTIDVASYFCHPGAVPDAFTGVHGEFCGTSAAAPTVAGAVSKVILGLRRHSGYTGSIEGRMVDPVLGVSIKDLRDAINLTASYTPPVQYALTENDYDNALGATVPVPPDAPWTLWGWGFYDGWVANMTLDVLLGHMAPPEKPDQARQWQGAQYAIRLALYG